jgi:hypothetical protein
LVTGENRVRVGVDEPGRDRAAVKVHRVRAGGRAQQSDLSDLSLTDPDAGARRQKLAAVEDGAVPEAQFLVSQPASPPLATRDTARAMPEIRPRAYGYVNAYDKIADKRYARNQACRSKSPAR